MIKYYTKSTISSLISVVPSNEIKLHNVCEDYGWSDKQMALFPTQQETWEKLQKSVKNC